jgi:DNA-directed RNA polymerase subunit K/omega
MPGIEQKVLLMDKLDDITLNHYEAVIAAAKRARMINTKRLAQLELMTEDADVEVDYRKVTSIALEQLLYNRIKYQYENQPENE